MLVASFATQARACILSDHNVFYTPRGGSTTAAQLNAPGAFLVLFRGHLPQTLGFPSPNKFLSHLLLHRLEHVS